MNVYDFQEIVSGGAGNLTDRRRKALAACVKCWDESLVNSDPKVRKAVLRRRVEQELYGNPLLLYLAFVILSAAITWAIERFLDWRFPKDEMLHEGRAHMLAGIQSQMKAAA